MDEDNDLIVVSANDKQSYCLDKHTDGTTNLQDDSQQDIQPCKVKLIRGSEKDNEVKFII